MAGRCPHIEHPRQARCLFPDIHGCARHPFQASVLPMPAHAWDLYLPKASTHIALYDQCCNCIALPDLESPSSHLKSLSRLSCSPQPHCLSRLGIYRPFTNEYQKCKHSPASIWCNSTLTTRQDICPTAGKKIRCRIILGARMSTHPAPEANSCRSFDIRGCVRHPFQATPILT